MAKDNLDQLSPAVNAVLEANHFQPTEVLRYGPRFAIILVKHGDNSGLFKMVLPIEERKMRAPSDYQWSWYDEPHHLENRLLKEALFLQFFSQELNDSGFEPQIIALSETSPVWSLRTFIDRPTMSAWGSDFVFSSRFFETFKPRTAIDFFVRLHDLSDILPESLRFQIQEFSSTLVNERRFNSSNNAIKYMAEFSPYADQMAKSFEMAREKYRDYRSVITHYEPYPPHIFESNGRIGLIDWENVGWGHQLQDFSVLYMRTFEHPEWQAEYVNILAEYGYFEGNGQLFWDSELLIQSFANHNYFTEYGPIGTKDYDEKAIQFFNTTIKDILTNSEYFSS